MKKNMDTIQFENRYEIDEVVDALQTYIKEHPNNSNKDTINKLIDLLNVMYMEW